MTLPKTPKGIGNQISRIRSQMSAFKREYGGIHDGSGNRYYLYYLYFLLGDNRRASEYIRWYQREFPDDTGEPFALLCWALLLRRMGKDGDFILAKTMLSNIYLLPDLLGIQMDSIEISHLSNQEEKEYLEYFPEQVRRAITAEDLDWIRERYETEPFKQAMKRYIEIKTELKHTPPGEKRSALVDELYALSDAVKKD